MATKVGTKLPRKTRGAATKHLQYIAMLSWLECSDSFKLITGSTQSSMKAVVAGSKLTKSNAYDLLADYVNTHCGTKWTGKEAGSRYRSYLVKYKQTNRKFFDTNGPKYMISAADIAAGISTIDAKLQKECTGYARMDILFGGRQNIRPTHLMETIDEDEVESDQDNDEDDNDEDDNDEDTFEDPMDANVVDDNNSINTLESALIGIENIERENDHDGKTPNEIKEYLQAIGY